MSEERYLEQVGGQYDTYMKSLQNKVSPKQAAVGDENIFEMIDTPSKIQSMCGNMEMQPAYKDCGY